MLLKGEGKMRQLNLSPRSSPWLLLPHIAPSWELAAEAEALPLVRVGASKPPLLQIALPPSHWAPSRELHVAVVRGRVGFLTHPSQSLTAMGAASSQSRIGSIWVRRKGREAVFTLFQVGSGTSQASYCIHIHILHCWDVCSFGIFLDPPLLLRNAMARGVYWLLWGCQLCSRQSQ